MAYILSGSETPAAEVCIFCARPAEGPARFRDNLILCAGEHAFVIMNKYPYQNGHLMVIPRRHVSDPADLTDAEFAATAELLRRATTAVRAAMTPHGVNIGMNLGRVAGAGIDTHCHYHIVPRWNGDHNFMPVLAETRSIGEHLEATYAKLAPHFAGLGQGPA
jgi:ATP adenylyltransferase